jgi:hypothetical protein
MFALPFSLLTGVASEPVSRSNDTRHTKAHADIADLFVTSAAGMALARL